MSKAKQLLRMPCCNPTDNLVLEGAFSGNADWVVTGDQDILVLHPFRGIEIVSPTNFLKHLSA